MPFLFYRDHAFTLVSHKAKQGIYYQSYTQRGFSRPSLLHNFPTSLYSATQDHDGTIHVISQTSKNQFTYFKINDTQVYKQPILEDAKNAYAFSDLSIQCFKNQVYLFYTALHPTGNSRSLLCQILTENSTVYTVIPELPQSPILNIYCVDDTISILYTSYEQSYTLRHITINDHMNAQDLVHSQFPLLNFNICRTPHQLHLTYLMDNFGTSQLVYVNSAHNAPVLLSTSPSITNPCILYYLDYIWITYMDNHRLFVTLSMDNGTTFSSPIPCSLQTNLDYYTFISHSSSILNASSLYASLLNTIRLPIISNLDTSGIHPDLSSNTELDLLLEGIKLRHTPMPTHQPSTHPLLKPLNITTQIPDSPQEPSPQPPLPLKPTSLAEAKKAFMQHGNGFDATPQ